MFCGIYYNKLEQNKTDHIIVLYRAICAFNTVKVKRHSDQKHT